MLRSEKIKKMRISKGLSVLEVAEAIKTYRLEHDITETGTLPRDISRVRNIEKGLTVPFAYELKAMAGLFGVSLKELLCA